MDDLRPITMLLIEDDPGNQKLIKTSLLEQRICNEVRVTESGEEAIDYLSAGKAGDSESPMPALILLDLNTPKMNGLELLKIVKADEDLKTIPVIILTTSGEQRDIVESFKLGVAGYMVKSVDYAEFTEMMRRIDNYWTLSRMPEQSCFVGAPMMPY